jgi:NAD+ kinase
MLRATVSGQDIPSYWPYALNEISLHRKSAEMLGIDASVGGMQLPTYWADGLLVSTASGSTAYNLSVGGPICPPDTKVMLLTPVAPHNLGLRPLVVSDDQIIELSAKSRSGKLDLTLDNRTYEIPSGVTVSVKAAPFNLKRVNLAMHNFIDALRSRFFWGQDVRNMPE